MSGPVRAYIAASFDGFIAGPDDDLSWLPEPPEDEDYGFGAFLADTEAILMGRNTYDIVVGFDGPWPYGDIPIFVATHRPVETNQPQVRSVSGTPLQLLDQVHRVTDGPVYVDGGRMIGQLLEHDLLDELTVTVVPVVLGGGSALLPGITAPHTLSLLGCETFDDGLVQLKYRPVKTREAHA